MKRSFRQFDNSVVYELSRAYYALDGGKTTEKTAAINT